MAQMMLMRVIESGGFPIIIMNQVKKTALILATVASVVGSAFADNGVQQLPPVDVKAEPLREEGLVGPYQQPEWTTARRFTSTRIYLQQQPWEVSVEQWVKAQWNRHESGNFLFQEEVEVGLPYRFQFDLYENWRYDTNDGKVWHDSIAAELRYALADWGKIWGNPTLYGEWVFSNHAFGPDKYEVKLLLGDQIAPRWHWGVNFIFEQEVGGSRETEIAVSGGLSYTLADERFSVGVEVKAEGVNDDSNRSSLPIEVDIGPSMQWRPTKNLHVDVTPLFGVNDHSPRVEAWLIIGYDFGGGNEKPHLAPNSTRSN